jgi:hypothetical protein
VANNFNEAVRPEWCSSFRLLFKVYVFVDDQQTFDFNYSYVDKLEQVVRECQEEIAALNWIKLFGPSLASFDHFQWRPGFALIQFENEYIQAQITFKTLFED